MKESKKGPVTGFLVGSGTTGGRTGDVINNLINK